MFKVIAILKLVTLFIMIGIVIFLIINQFRKRKSNKDEFMDKH